MRLIPLMGIATIVGFMLGGCITQPWGTYNHGTEEELTREIYGAFAGAFCGLAVVNVADVIGQCRRRRE